MVLSKITHESFLSAASVSTASARETTTVESILILEREPENKLKLKIIFQKLFFLTLKETSLIFFGWITKNTENDV
jgi:hypothetical protein